MNWRSAAQRLLLAVLPLFCGSILRAGPDAPDPRYYRYDQVVQLFTQWEADYPTIFHPEVIGSTLVGHEAIWAAKISDRAPADEREPTLVFHGAQHANEPNGTGAVLYMMRRLLEGYGQDPYLTAMVDSLQIWFVPVVNVDGHRLAFGGSPSWASWRKTSRDNNGDGAYTFPDDGVDTNRNWDWHWTEFDSTDYHSLEYKGPYPFSEPEAAAVRDLVMREAPVFVMDYHSPVADGPPNVIWWPWRNSGTGLLGPDAPFYRPIALGLGARTLTEIDSVTFSGWNPGSDYLPKEQNWIYAHTGTCALLMEISSTNWWQGAMVDTIAARVGRGSFYLCERAMSGPGLTGVVKDAGTGVPLVAQIWIANHEDPSIGPRQTDYQFGAYWRLLTGGEWFGVTITAPHYVPVTELVYIRSQGWTRFDANLAWDQTGDVADDDPPFIRSRETEGTSLLLMENPQSSGGSVRLRLPREEQIRLRLFHANGRELATLRDARLSAGDYRVPLPQNLSSGVFWLRLDLGGRSFVSKITILR